MAAGRMCCLLRSTYSTRCNGWPRSSASTPGVRSLGAVSGFLTVRAPTAELPQECAGVRTQRETPGFAG
jgi:hypothetical protein